LDPTSAIALHESTSDGDRGGQWGGDRMVSEFSVSIQQSLYPPETPPSLGGGVPVSKALLVGRHHGPGPQPVHPPSAGGRPSHSRDCQRLAQKHLNL